MEEGVKETSNARRMTISFTNIRELCELRLCRGHAEILTYFGCEGWTGGARKD